MRRVLPVGIVSAGVSDTVIVTDAVFLATLLSVMTGALTPSDPLTIATMEPVVDWAITTPSIFVTAAAKLVIADCNDAGFCTVLGRENVIAFPPKNVPDFRSTTRVSAFKVAYAAGDICGSTARDGLTKTTEFEDRRCGIEPDNVIEMVESTGTD